MHHQHHRFLVNIVLCTTTLWCTIHSYPVTNTINLDCSSLERLFLASGDIKQVSVEATGVAADVVFRGLSTSLVRASMPPPSPPSATAPSSTAAREDRKMPTEDEGREIGLPEEEIFTAFFELVNTYKGADELDMWDPINYRRVNVTLTPGPQGLSHCYNNAHGILSSTPIEYIVFCKVDRSVELAPGKGRQLRLIAVATWDEYADERLWMALGWSAWSEWSSCSVSCSTGTQQRLRHCRLHTCPGFNIEQRQCNLFSCANSFTPLTHAHIDYFHRPKEQWASITDRSNAFHFTSNSYIWLPSIKLFETTEPPDATKTTEDVEVVEQVRQGRSEEEVGVVVMEKDVVFPREFVLFITVRVLNSSYGTIFSLRSRRRQDAYLSLEAAGSDVKVIHAARNGTDVIRVPAKLDDGNWHQIAVGIRDDSVIDSYVDCQWSRTDILRKGSLDIPDDSDLIVGYLFEGDLEQLTIVPDPTVVGLQCTNDVTPIVDSSVQNFRSIIASSSTAATLISHNNNVRLADVKGNDVDNLESNTIETG